MELEYASPHMNGNMYARMYHDDPLVMDILVNNYIREQEHYRESVHYSIKEIQTLKGLKQFIKEFQIDDEEIDLDAFLQHFKF